MTEIDESDLFLDIPVKERIFIYTYSKLDRVVDRIKKQRLTDDIVEVMARNDFVELDL